MRSPIEAEYVRRGAPRECYFSSQAFSSTQLDFRCDSDELFRMFPCGERKFEVCLTPPDAQNVAGLVAIVTSIHKIWLLVESVPDFQYTCIIRWDFFCPCRELVTTPTCFLVDPITPQIP